jgi:succinyl-diaminopimelate desuccinylase
VDRLAGHREVSPSGGGGAAGPGAADLGALTAELIAIPSVSGDEAALAAHVAARLAGAPGETLCLGNNVVHRGPRRPGRPLVVLAGHLDTVPPQGNAAPRFADGRLYGRGASDMKAGLAVMLALAGGAGPAPAPDAARFDLAWVFYECEEVAFERNGLRRLWDEMPWLAEAALAVLLEPTDGAAELGCLGSLHAELTVRGRAAHSARPWLGENALYKALPLVARLAAVGPREVAVGGVTYRETLQVTTARCGVGRNVVPDAFTCNVNLRFAPTRAPEAAAAELRALAGADAEVAVVDVSPAAPPAAEHPLIAEFLARYALPRRAKQAWTDVAQFAARGVPALNFGPGVPETAHQADESLPLANLERAHAVLRDFLWSAGGAGG